MVIPINALTIPLRTRSRGKLLAMSSVLTEFGHAVYAVLWALLMVIFIISPANSLGTAGYRSSWALLLLIPLWLSRRQLSRTNASIGSSSRILLGGLSAVCELAMGAILLYIYTSAVLTYCGVSHG